MLYRKKYMDFMVRLYNTPELIKILTGHRRAGKSTILLQIQEDLKSRGIHEDHILYLNFEDYGNVSLKDPDALYKCIKQFRKGKDGTCFLFFDEIQEVRDWEKVINSFRASGNCDIYATGSNAGLLSGELATLIAGRYVTIEIFPFSFAEFSELAKAGNQDANPHTLFQSYLLLGGLPYISQKGLSQEDSQVYLRDVYNSVMLKDIVKRYKIRDVELLERILYFIMDQTGNTFSAHSISKYFKNQNRKVSVDTVMNYLRFCQDAFLIRKIPRQDLQGKRILEVDEKYYLTDHGLRQAVLGTNQRDIQQVLENIVCMELLRRGYDVTIGKTGKQEIDFVASKGGKTAYFQVCYLLADPATIDREFAAYAAIKDNWPKHVLSLDSFDFSRDGIKHMNLMDFLLNPTI